MNPDIFAIISSADGSAASRSIIDHEFNKIWSVPARSIANAGHPSAPNCLVLTFSKLRATHSTSSWLQGKIVCLGTDCTCQIVLGHRGTSLMSPWHCYILVSRKLRIYVRDHASAYGTAINYHGPVNTRDNHCGLTHRRQWVVALEPGSQRLLEVFTLKVGQTKFDLQFPNHAQQHPQYMHNLRWLSKACNETWTSTRLLPFADSVSINSTWKTKLYYLYRIIKRKRLATMYEGICTHDGRVVAIKQFSPRNDMSREGWAYNIQQEFDAMNSNRHHNIARVLEIHGGDRPKIIMEYFNHADLTTANLNSSTVRTVLWQILDALDHVHSHGHIHNSVQMEHILLHTDTNPRAALTGFRSARNTYVQTQAPIEPNLLENTAPEVFLGLADGRSKAVDIWVLAVVAVKLLYSLPPMPPTSYLFQSSSTSPSQWRDWTAAWHSALMVRVMGSAEGPLAGILGGMLVWDPRDRWSARDCLRKACQLGLAIRRDSLYFST